WRPTAPWPRRSASTVRPATARWPRSTTSPTPITGSKRPWTPVSRRAPPPLIVIMVIWLLGEEQIRNQPHRRWWNDQIAMITTADGRRAGRGGELATGSG